MVHAVAAVADQSPLDPLSGVVDPDALDSLVPSSTLSGNPGDVHATFTFCGHEVTLHSYGKVDVTSSD